MERCGQEKSFSYFQASSPLNLTYVEGQNVFISCSLNRPLRKDSRHKVSFLRLRDFGLLFVGSQRHNRDPRLEVSPSPDQIRREWTLQIRGARQNDSGIYECQLNTEPQSRSLLVNVFLNWNSLKYFVMAFFLIMLNWDDRNRMSSTVWQVL